MAGQAELNAELDTVATEIEGEVDAILQQLKTTNDTGPAIARLEALRSAVKDRIAAAAPAPADTPPAP
jgi:hypothetical protein